MEPRVLGMELLLFDLFEMFLFFNVNGCYYEEKEGEQSLAFAGGCAFVPCMDLY